MNPLAKLIAPRLPSAAVGLSAEGVGVVKLDRRRDLFVVQRAGYLPLRGGLVRPSFDEPNLEAPAELAAALSELTATTGLGKRRRWSATLPEAATRTSILTMESAPASRHEAEEMLRWKTERALGAPPDELRVSRERLPPDAQGRARYLVAAVRLSVLAEYEAVFGGLGWQAGLILPRHMGEAWWLMRDGARSLGDSLLVSGHADGFTAVILRAGQPLYVRVVSCEPEDRADELFRFLLFYRDRHAPASAAGDIEAAPAAPTDTIGRLLVAGTGVAEAEAAAIVEETLSVPPRPVRAGDLRLSFPEAGIEFEQLAAPAGLAALAWA
ncbi:MAG TPA: hypothetical protein VN228_05770 [Pyrinomonadaceae bacterium]|nr:hypothetical protein [Pyrinomonadaceae bacterium]